MCMQTSHEVIALVAQLEDEERSARQAAELGPSFACSVCLEAHVPLLAGHRLGCGHTYCTACIGEHVRVKVRSHEISREALTCPSCAAPIGVSDVHALTWRCGDDETWRKFEAVSDEIMIESLVRDGGARRCPNEHCNYAFVWSREPPGSRRTHHARSLAPPVACCLFVHPPAVARCDCRSCLRCPARPLPRTTALPRAPRSPLARPPLAPRSAPHAPLNSRLSQRATRCDSSAPRAHPPSASRARAWVAASAQPIGATRVRSTRSDCEPMRTRSASLTSGAQRMRMRMSASVSC